MQINQNINPNIFGKNSIQNYNKFLQNEMEALNVNFDNKGMVDFDSVLNGKIESNNSVPQGPIINSGIQMNVGLENIGITPVERVANSQPVTNEKNRDSMSAVEKTAYDIGKGFSNALNNVNNAQNEAYNAAETFATGGDISVHEVMLASQKANLTMQMALQMRNRIISAYTEINNVRV